MRFLALLRILILRNIREEKFLTFLSIIGIALGIGLFTGVKVASDRAIASFAADISGITPSANYEILDISGIDFDEQIYRDVRTFETNTFPVLKTFGYLESFKDTVDINGIYTVKAAQFLKLSRHNPPSPSLEKEKLLQQGIDLEHFYSTPNGILITKTFSDRYSVNKGDTLKTLVYDKEYLFKIIGIVESESLIPNMALMDIGNFQEYFGKTGYLSRIDLISDKNTAGQIQAILPANLRIEKKEEIFKNQKALVASFRYNLQFVSLISILVGVFLLYNTVFISIIKRRTEIGILRGLGADKRTIILLFTFQGLVLGVIGSALGILMGQFAAYVSVRAVEKTLSTMYGAISITDYFLTAHDAFAALLLGLVVSLIASVIPSYEASKIRPNESAREGSFEGRYRKYQNTIALSGVFCFVLGIVVSYIDYRHMPFAFPFPAYAGILLIIAGFTFVSPFYLTIILKILTIPLTKWFGAIGNITLGDIKGSTYRFSVALMSVAISSALIIALLTIIFSLRNSLTGWINKNITADIYIKPASCTSNYCFYPMSERVIDIVKTFPEVEGIDTFRGLHLDLFGNKVTAGFADTEVKKKFLQRRYHDREYEHILHEMEGGERVVGISEYISIKYGLKKGDTIPLQTPRGTKAFRINDVSSSYATTTGFLYLDKKWLKEYWGLDDATQISVYLEKNADVGLCIQKLREKLLPQYSLLIMNNNELREKILHIFNKSFAITYAIEGISIAVSLIGIINTLMALVFERRREISIMRYLGASWKQIQGIFLLSAGIIGTTGIILGILLGTIMSVILIFVVNKISFGWEIRFTISLFYLSAVIILLFFTTLCAGVLPSKAAQRIDPKRFASFE
jgi:putative ABC transport system permease protein